MGDFLIRLTKCQASCYLSPSPSVLELIEVDGLLTRPISRTKSNPSVLELEVDGLVGGLTN